MEEYYSLADVRRQPGVVLAIGAFDGVHLGHQKILELARNEAHSNGLQFAILTFDPLPQTVINPSATGLMLSHAEEKISLLRSCRPDILVVQPFTRDFARLSADQFIDQIEEAFDLKDIVLGFDFRYGRGREGDIDHLQARSQKDGFSLQVLPREGPGAVAPGVSSSAIRQALKDGDVVMATDLLGRPFSLEGQIVHGDGRGKQLGYRTANMAIPAERLIPAPGVYAGRARLGAEEFAAAISIGTNPQFDGHSLSVEAHLLDFERDVYGECLEITFNERLRPQARFTSVGELVEQIGRDVEYIRELMAASHGVNRA